MYQNISEYIRIYQNISEYIRMYLSISEYFNIYPNISESFRTCQNIPEYIRDIPVIITEYHHRYLTATQEIIYKWTLKSGPILSF